MQKITALYDTFFLESRDIMESVAFVMSFFPCSKLTLLQNHHRRYLELSQTSASLEASAALHVDTSHQIANLAREDFSAAFIFVHK